MKKLWKIGLLLAVSMLLIVGCSKDKNEDKVGKKYQIYYCNSEETELVGMDYWTDTTDTIKLIEELIDALSKEPDSIKYKKVKPDSVSLLSAELNDDKQLTLRFNRAYSDMTGVSEILFRAAVVKMMCQIGGVSYVEFYIEDQPLMKSADKPYGFQTAEDFLDNTGRETNFRQNVTMSLYFADKSGKALKEVVVNMDYDGSVSLEQLILQRLIDGPEAIQNIDTQVQATIPKDTVVQKTSVREGVCYVYLNDAFMNKLPDITDEVAIYSVVNSLCDLSSVSKVQFMIDGKTVAMYRENVVFDGLFERNLDLVKG